MACRSAAVLLHPVTLFHDTRASGWSMAGAVWSPVGICVQEFPQHLVEDQDVLSMKRNTIAKHHYFPLWLVISEGGCTCVEGVDTHALELPQRLAQDRDVLSLKRNISKAI